MLVWHICNVRIDCLRTDSTYKCRICIIHTAQVTLRTELVRGKGSAEAGTYTAAEVWGAVDSATPALEVLGSRLLANGLTNWERAADGGE